MKDIITLYTVYSLIHGNQHIKKRQGIARNSEIRWKLLEDSRLEKEGNHVDK